MRVRKAFVELTGGGLRSAADDPVTPAEGGLVRLSEAANGHPVMVRAVDVTEARLARHLEALGLVPGRFLVVERCAPFGGAVMVRVGDARYALGRAVCDQILVEPLAA